MNSLRGGLLSAKPETPPRSWPRGAVGSEEEFLAFADSKPQRKEFMLAMRRKGFPEKEMNAALERMRRTYERMDAEIAASGGPWLMGKRITLADVAVMPALVRMADLNLDGMWKEMPRIVRWYARSARTPQFKPNLFRLVADRALCAISGRSAKKEKH